jgi:glycosyltransferase involved in cell wall biosynthesis
VRLAKAFLMPGLVGLAVLDAFAYGTPMVTTDLPYHSPEIDYLEDGVNGVMVRDSEDPLAYARAVARVLTDDAYRAQLQAGGQAAMATYTIENMASRFAAGVVTALGS